MNKCDECIKGIDIIPRDVTYMCMPHTKGRRLTEELVREISSKYISLTEWYNNDPSSCKAAKRLGIYDELKNSKNIRRESTPQRMVEFVFNKLLNETGLYNFKEVIKPYEIDVYYPDKKFGVEYDGHAFHAGRYMNKERENKKKVKESEHPEIYILHISEDRYYKHGEFFEFIIKSILKNLDDINNWCRTSISAEDVKNVKIYDINSLIQFNWNDVMTLINSYDSGSEFRKNNRSLYHKIIKLEKHDILKHISNRTIGYNKAKLESENNELIKFVLDKHAAYRDFYEDRPLYLTCNYKRTIIKKIKNLYVEKELDDLENFISNVLSKYKSYRDFNKNLEDNYRAKRLGVLQKIKRCFYTRDKDTNLIKWFNILNEQEQINYIKYNFNNISEFIKHRKLYDYYYRRNKLSYVYDILT